MKQDKISIILKNTEEILNILRKKDKQGHFVVCSHCNYSWKTSSKMSSVSCPHCNNKTKNSADGFVKDLANVGKGIKNNIDKNYAEGKSVLDLDYNQ